MSTQDWAVSGGLPPELATEYDQLRRRRALAEAMLARGMAPALQPQQTGRLAVPMSPLAPLAQMVSAYVGKKGMDEADAGMKGVGAKYNEGLAQAIKEYQTSGQGKTIMPDPQEVEQSADQGTPAVSPAHVAPDPRARVAQAMASPYAPVRQLGMMDYQAAVKQGQPFTLKPGETQYGPDGKPIVSAPFKPDPTKAPPTRTVVEGEIQIQQELQPDGTWKEVGRGPRFARQVAPVVNVSGGGAKPQKAPSGYRFNDDGELEPIPGGPKDPKAAPPKPLPAPALKIQQEELEAIGTASSINADLGGIEKLITDGKLKPSLLGNAMNNTLNTLGLSTEESRNLATFKSTLEKMRNDSLRLNKGVQTEGDAVRAWNELIANISDKGVVTQRLAEIRKINERAANLRRMNIDVVRANYGLPPLDVSGHQNQPTAIGAPQLIVAPGTPMPGAAAPADDPLGLRKR